MERIDLIIAGAVICLLSVSTGFAQDKSNPLNTAFSTQIYDDTFFSKYNLSNAEEMLRRLPGVPNILDGGGATTSQSRGLGAGAEQILVNNKRTASKTDNVAAILRRIPAGQVLRVELIRGASSEVRSEGLIVNVVLKEDEKRKGVGTAELNYRFDNMGWGAVDGLISYSGSAARLAYVIGVENNAWTLPLGLTPSGGANDWSRRTRDERYFYPSGAVQELRPQDWRRHARRTVVTASTSYNFANGDTLRLNALYQPNPVIQTDLTNSTRFSTTGAPSGQSTERHYNENRKDTTELGGEFEKKLGPGKFNAIGLYTRSDVTLLDYRNRYDAANVLTELNRSANSQQTGESVLRASYEWPLSNQHVVTLGGEVANNYLTQNLKIFADLDRNGRLEDIFNPTALAHVEEIRGETFVTDDWKIRPDLTLTTSLTFEMSRITTNYPAIPVRTIHYIKPRFDLRYNPTVRDHFRAKIERVISQLDFANFVPAYNVVDSRIDLGNPLIVPGKSWLNEVAYERRLPKDNGALEARVFYRYFTDGTTFVPFGFNSSGLPISARGNLTTSNYVAGFETAAAVRLSWLGLPGAQVNVRVLKNFSGTIDAFTNTKRKGSSAYDEEYTLGFRNDITRWGASYGADYLKTEGPQIVSDVRNYETQTRGSRINAFVEKKLTANYSVRFEAYGLNGAHEDKQRRIYAISQGDGTLSRLEQWQELRDRRFVLKLRGKF